MKNLILLLAAILFSILFYNHTLGLNIFLYALINIGILTFFNPKKIKTKATLIFTIIYLTTSFFVFIINSDLTIFASLVSFIFLVGSVSENKSSLYIKFFNGIYSTFIGVFSKYFNRFEEHIPKAIKLKTNYTFVFKIVTIPLTLILIFITLYKNTNPVFANLINKIDLSFINIGWLIFTLFGFYLYRNISKPIVIEPLTKNDVLTTNNLINEQVKINTSKKDQQENKIGLTVLILLNLLLIVLIITDVVYLNQENNFTSDQLKNQLHQSINSLIFSIILAISIIIYLFKGSLNFYKENLLLKKMTYFWIGLNVILALICIYKNTTYITNFGLTYKRIGVYVYLTLALTGLVFITIKVLKTKNINYLFRKSIQVAFLILILSSFINWDVFITKYNIKNDRINLLQYMISLSDKNATQLIEYSKNRALNQSEMELINHKLIYYNANLKNNSWQEVILANFYKENNAR